MISRALTVLVACLFLFTGVHLFSQTAPAAAGASTQAPAPASQMEQTSPNDPIDIVLPAALAWMKQIDVGDYEGSYESGGQGLHDVLDEKKWILVLKTLRPPWGAVVNRQPFKHAYQPDGIQGLGGECMAIAFNTDFAKQPGAMEIVILRKEDGKWRGVGYTARPNQTPVGEMPQTESSSNTIHGGSTTLPANMSTAPTPAPSNK